MNANGTVNEAAAAQYAKSNPAALQMFMQSQNSFPNSGVQNAQSVMSQLGQQGGGGANYGAQAQAAYNMTQANKSTTQQQQQAAAPMQAPAQQPAVNPQMAQAEGAGGAGADTGASADQADGMGDSAADGGAQGGPEYAKGGKITSTPGHNPPGPDTGQINAQRGEYVIRRSATKRYGKDVLDALNKGRIDPEQLRGLVKIGNR